VTRCKPITQQLRSLLNAAADATGIQKIVITSGGQSSNHDPATYKKVCGWTGSRRHDNGRAADLQLIKNGKTLTFSNTDGSQVADFVTACAARGATGIGAATDYMGPRTIHVGFGKSINDNVKLTWGKDGASANAPNWLKKAAEKGWDNPVPQGAPMPESTPAAVPSVVMARDGLWLRRGPGLGFDRAMLLAAGTPVTVLGHDGDWARIDLQGDGLIDGHVFAAFLSANALRDSDEGEEEIVSEDMIAAFIAMEATKQLEAVPPLPRAQARASRKKPSARKKP
jgi:hypothetical protein